MTIPDDKRRRSPADRFRNIMSDGQGRDTGPTSRVYPKGTLSPAMNNLPRPNSQRPEGEGPLIITSAASQRPGGRGYLPVLWTTASIISLVVNAVLVVVVLILLGSTGSIDPAKITVGVLGGLYHNFERMDQAHIQTTIPIQAEIPLNLSVPVQTTTGITLAKDVSIPGAHVRINTALFNIDAPADVTLPAGTSMDVTMSFTLPVQSQVPVSMNVPVDIPLQQTELHPAISGLEDTIRPLYCMMSPLAQSLNGQPVCR